MLNEQLKQSNLLKKVENYPPPKLNGISKIGIVSRDYSKKDFNNYSDFSYTFNNILSSLDKTKSDLVLFSAYTIYNRNGFNVLSILESIHFTSIKAIIVEECSESTLKKGTTFIVYFKEKNCWKEYKLSQKFGNLKYTKTFEREIIIPFIDEVENKRLLGSCTVLFCGESNVVKYSKNKKEVEDPFNYLGALNKDIRIILNPIHDRMTRFEMKFKRNYLSSQNRWVISVWNKGKTDKNGCVRDGKNPAWTIFKNGKEINVVPLHLNISNRIGLEIGLLDISDK